MRTIALPAVLALLAGAVAAQPIGGLAGLAHGVGVTLSGTVERILDEDEVLLADATGTVEVYGSPDLGTRVAVGEAVTVAGLLDDDGALEVYATAVTRADGTVLRFDPDA